MNYRLPEPLAPAVQATLADWQRQNKVQRLWSRDASLWTGADEGRWLGWLGIVEEQIAQRERFEALATEIRSAGFTHALLLGMGGSSLCVEVLKLTFGKIAGYPEMFVLDSTDPAQVRAVEAKVDLAKTIFIVASKSGSTLEPNIFERYFFERVKQVVGAAEAGKRFIAITDPGSQPAKVRRGLRLPPCLFRCCEHRGALLGAFEFRHGSRSHPGARHRPIPRAYLADGSRVRPLCARQRKPRGDPRRHSGDAREERAR